VPFETPTRPVSAEASDSAALLVRLGDRHYGLPLGVVERVFPMAAVVPLPEQSQGLIGMLNLHGEILPVIDPRPRLGLPTPRMNAEHRLVLVRGGKPFLLWVDDVDEVVGVGREDVANVPAQHVSPVVPRVLRLAEKIVPLLAPTALEPRASFR
jgi:purine-binding chemotaxis protein CheW